MAFDSKTGNDPIGGTFQISRNKYSTGFLNSLSVIFLSIPATVFDQCGNDTKMHDNLKLCKSPFTIGMLLAAWHLPI